ncbi:MAG TPA: putative lipid II flippase FtsW [Myxococcales bacterium]|nr:putative lipid II flippase FtsW [Deltaproteobacteria bacterium]MBU54512.1 putative lipid II flippase FtsW [Deltaproteobacteria bacterium]HAA58563.1 putative lipid II flippase FtsW [Myxococcales bacterium]|tara:strand:+ start:5639 stop:6874 length:1236 start_codon:yes stop_codon:yes gene_type:complete
MEKQRKEMAIWSDPWLLFIAIALALLGVVMIYSSTHNLAQERMHDAYFFLKKHMLSLFAGCVALYLTTIIPLEKMRMLVIPLLLGVFGLLVLVLVPGFGVRAGGAIRWIKIAGIRLGQPAELAKLAVIFYLASSLARKQDRIEHFMVGFVPNVIIVGAIVGLLMLQPDFGTSMMLLTIMGIMMFVGRVPIQYLLGSAMLALPAVYLALIWSPYRWKRIMSFLDPMAKENIQDGAYQLVQSLKAFASGGLWGLGVGHGKQKLGYLPEAHTDFIFAVVGEELGLIGVLFVIGGILFLIYRGFRISQRTPVLFYRFLALGLTCMIGVQTLINMGVVMGSLPTKGMPMPFISFARSSLIVVLAAIGVLLQIEYDTQQKQLKQLLSQRSKKTGQTQKAKKRAPKQANATKDLRAPA